MSDPVYIQGCTTDVFVSYAHIDNEPFGEEGRRWATSLRDLLGKRVAQHLGASISIWFDDKLDGNQEFSRVLVERIQGAAALVPVFSPRYVESEWCQRELREFLDGAGDDLVRQDRSRVFKALKLPVPRDQQPAVLRGQLGYEFFRKLASDKVLEFHLDPDENERLRNWLKIDDLAQDLAKLLKLMHSAPPGAATSQPPRSRVAPGSESVARPPRCVYLAETTSDLRPERDDIRRDLEGRRYRVLPEGPLPARGRSVT